MDTTVPSSFVLYRRLLFHIGSVAKRLLDVMVSLVALLLLSPAFFLVSIAIRRDSPGPVIYRGRRLGYGGKVFQILKFRTMIEAPESYQGPPVTAHDDARITALGHWLRDTKLNELPQFWNVLVGEMSLVGPRPEDPMIAKTWPVEVWKEIVSVRPGITSPATVYYHNEETLLNSGSVLDKYIKVLTPDKLRLDQLYVRNRSFWLDLDVLFWTALIMLPLLGRTPPPENWMFAGPVARMVSRYIQWLAFDLLLSFMVFGVITAIAAPGLSPGHWMFSTGILALMVTLLYETTGYLVGVNRVNWAKATLRDVTILLPGWLAVILASVLVQVGTFWSAAPPPAFYAVGVLLSLMLFTLARFWTQVLMAVYYSFTSSRPGPSAGKERLLIVGSGRTAEHMAWLLSHPAYSRQLTLVGFVDEDFMNQGQRVYGRKVLGAFRDLPELIRKHNIGLVLVADHRIGVQEYQGLENMVHGTLVRMLVVPDIFGSLDGLVGQHALTAGESELYQLRCRHCLANASVQGSSEEMR